MAEPFAPPPSGEPITYRPISGFALAGLIASVLFALLVLVSGSVALVQGVPIFFPPWTMLLAGVGLVLSLLGLNQIRNAEGTRAGESLARAGVWVSVLSGLGYFAYYFFTSLALTSQANEFMTRDDRGFFPLIKKGMTDPTALNAAFLLTVPATSRGAIKPDDAAGMARAFDQPGPDGSAGNLSQFKDHFVVRMFRASPTDATVEALGVQDWDYENRSYKVVRNYRVRAPEAEVDIRVPVQSTEGEAGGQARQWFVVWTQAGRTNVRYTPLGDGLNQLRAQSRNVIEQWARQLNEGETYPAYKAVDRTDWDRAVPDEAKRAEVREQARQLFEGTRKNRLSLTLGLPDGFGNWRVADGRVELLHPFRLILTRNEGGMQGLEGDLIVQTRGPVDPLQISTPPAWDITGIRFNRHFATEMKK